MSSKIIQSIKTINELYAIIKESNGEILTFINDNKTKDSVAAFYDTIDNIITSITAKINLTSASSMLKQSTILAFTETCNITIKSVEDKMERLENELIIVNNYFCSDEAMLLSKNNNPELNFLIAINNNSLTGHEKKEMLRVAADDDHPEAIRELLTLISDSKLANKLERLLAYQDLIMNDFKITISSLNSSKKNDVFLGIIEWSDDALLKSNDFITNRIVAYAYETSITTFSPELKGFSSVIHRLHNIYTNGIGVPCNQFKVTQVEHIKHLLFELDNSKYINDNESSFHSIINKIQSSSNQLSLVKFA